MSGFSIRHYLPETDLSLLSRMLTEIESGDCDGEDTSEKYLLASLEWQNYRPHEDVWVAETEGNLVGYAVALEQPSRRCILYVVVHPSQRRRGLGTQLLELVLTRAREVDSQAVLVYANEHNQASNLFLRYHGFEQVGSSGAMKVPAAFVIPSFELPAGFTLKRYSEVNDSLILLSALKDCYLDMWGHQHNDRPTEEELKSPRFLNYYNSDDILLLFDSKNVISGICSLKPEGKTDESHNSTDLLDAPGIIKKYRGRGYQHQLVLAGIQHLRQKGTRSITLEFWGDDEKTLKIYHELGFERVNQFFAYHKEFE